MQNVVQLQMKHATSVQVLITFQGSWEKKIIERVHNVSATMKKRPVSDDGESTPKAKRGRPRQQSLVLTRYPPLRDTADDSITRSRNAAALKKELEKDTPRKETVLSLSRQTFTMRREEILVDSGEVNATGLLNQFKELHKSYVVMAHFTILSCMAIVCKCFTCSQGMTLNI